MSSPIHRRLRELQIAVKEHLTKHCTAPAEPQHASHPEGHVIWEQSLRVLIRHSQKVLQVEGIPGPYGTAAGYGAQHKMAIALREVVSLAEEHEKELKKLAGSIERKLVICCPDSRESNKEARRIFDEQKEDLMHFFEHIMRFTQTILSLLDVLRARFVDRCAQSDTSELGYSMANARLEPSCPQNKNCRSFVTQWLEPMLSEMNVVQGTLDAKCSDHAATLNAQVIDCATTVFKMVHQLHLEIYPTIWAKPTVLWSERNIISAFIQVTERAILAYEVILYMLAQIRDRAWFLTDRISKARREGN